MSTESLAPEQSGAPDLLYSEIEDDLRASVRALLADRSPWNAVLARCETNQPYDPALWRALAADLGLASLAIPEKLGGAGASWREVAVVAEEVGRAVAPVPFLTSSVIATAVVLELNESAASAVSGAGSVSEAGAVSGAGTASEADAGLGELLDRLASGRTTAVLALPFSSAPEAAFPNTIRADDAGRLSGKVTSVADALVADLLLVPAVTAAGPALFAVDVNAAGVGRDGVTSLDLTRPLTDLSFENVAGRLLGSGRAAEAALSWALGVGAAVLASEQLGIAEACLELSVTYLKTRYQFGRLIGSYQALKHRAADLWASVAQARAVARYAAACVADDDPDAPVAAALAQAYCSGVAVRAAEECVQFHGGIGFTWEHPAHLYLKRAKSASIALGTASRHRAALGRLVNLPAADLQ